MEDTSPANHASLGDRALAQLVDGLIVIGLFFLFGMFLAGRFGGNPAMAVAASTPGTARRASRTL